MKRFFEKNLPHCLIVFSLSISLVCLGVSFSFAAEGDDDAESTFSSPADVRAANLSDASPNYEDMTEEQKESLSARFSDEEKEALDVQISILENDPTQDEEDAANAAIADIFAVTSEDVSSMREEGMGWGEIAHELGVHPGTLGLGHTKQNGESLGKNKFSDEEVAAATARDLKTGWSKGHGVKGAKSDSNKGLGLSNGKAKGRAKDSGGPGGDNGKGKSGGNSGSNGNGGGKGSGKDK